MSSVGAVHSIYRACTVRSVCCDFICFVRFSHFGFESRILVLIVPVHDHCLLGLFFLSGQRFSMCLN